MPPEHALLYRSLLRELKRAAPSRPNLTIVSNLRALLEQSRLQDARNALLFLRSQREYQTLVERYNPLSSLSEQERIRKTANRVGLDVPKD